MASTDSFLQLDAEALGQIRKTSEDPPRVSIFDVIRAVTGQADPHKIYSRLTHCTQWGSVQMIATVLAQAT